MAECTPAKSTLPAPVDWVGGDTPALRMFTVEWVTPPMAPREVEMARHALAEASRRVTWAGAPVRCLRCAYRRSEDRWVCVFVAADEATIRRAYAIAQVQLTTVAEIQPGVQVSALPAPCTGPAGRSPCRSAAPVGLPGHGDDDSTADGQPHGRRHVIRRPSP